MGADRQGPGEAERPVRVAIDLKPKDYLRLQGLEQLMEGDSRVDVVRDAIRLYAFLAERTARGEKVLVVRPDGTSEALVFLGLPPV
jgi:hypothetical protein